MSLSTHPAKSVYHRDNLDKLCTYALQANFRPVDQKKIAPLCLHNLISNNIDIMQQYVRSGHITQIFPLWMIEYFPLKYTKKSHCNRAFYTHVKSWRIHLDSSLQLKLGLGFLTKERGRPHIIKHFLKLRKEIVKGRIATLDQITLDHEQIIAILYRIYPETKRKLILKKINDCYLAHQQQKHLQLQSSVFCQFLLNNYQEIESTNQEFKITKQNRVKTNSAFSSNIDVNNGMFSPKRPDKQGCNSRDAVTKRSVNRRPQQQKRDEFQQMTQRITRNYKKNQETSPSRECGILSNFFNQTSGQGLFSQMSPGRLFKTAERQFGNFRRMDCELDSKRSDINCNSQSAASISSFITEKYSEDWSRMLQINQQFKNRILRKTKDQLNSIQKYPHPQEHVFYKDGPEQEHIYQQDKEEGFSFQGSESPRLEDCNIQWARESIPIRSQAYQT